VSLYHEGCRALQDRFGTRRLAERIEERLVRDHLTEEDRDFVVARDMLFLATADADGRPQSSYKGGDPGFVRVLDERTIAFPSYDGNGMYASAGNVAVNARVGILFIDFEGRRRLRLNGLATQSWDDPLLAASPGAQLVWRVRVSEVFPNCARYVHHYRLVERSRFVPLGDRPPPVPRWKTRAWSRDVLPEADPARDPSAEIE
jgi:uncharacterized protein